MKQKTNKATERKVYVEFKPGVNVKVLAESDAEAVDKVDQLITKRKLVFDADSVRDDLLENVATIRCGEVEFNDYKVKTTKKKQKTRCQDPFRYSIETKAGANEGFVLDENAKQFAESVVNYPTTTSWVSVRKDVDSLGERWIIYGQFHNHEGHTEHVDDCLERFTMRHWREIADHITRLMLAKAGESDTMIDLTDWPTPEITVTKTADVHDNDCIDLVKFEWVTAEKVFNLLADSLMKAEDAEEVCPYCDATITFKPREGKDILICPECGKAFCACSLCDCANHGSCDECEVSKTCDRIYDANEVYP